MGGKAFGEAHFPGGFRFSLPVGKALNLAHTDLFLWDACRGICHYLSLAGYRDVQLAVRAAGVRGYAWLCLGFPVLRPLIPCQFCFGRIDSQCERCKVDLKAL